MAKVAAVFLAAGLSSRMGDQNKMLLSFNNTNILNHSLKQVIESYAFEVNVVCNNLTLSKVEYQNHPKVKVYENPNYKSGMTSSIQVGVKHSNENADGFMVCLGDMPLLNPSDFNTLIEAFNTAFEKDPNAIVVPFYEGKKANPVIFSKAYKQNILNHSAPEGCKEIVQANKPHLTIVNVDFEGFMRDIDVPEDYVRLRERT